MSTQVQQILTFIILIAILIFAVWAYRLSSSGKK